MEMEGADMEKNQPPWLLITHGDEYSKQSFYSTLDKRFYTTSIPELCNKEIIPCAYGWLVLVDIETEDCCLWNPVSMKKIELPELEDYEKYNVCVMSKPPTDPDCHILFNSACGYHQAFCQLGDHEFVTQSTEDEDGGDEEINLMGVGSFQDKIYGFIRPGFQFVTAHFVGKTLELRPILMDEEGQHWNIPDPSPMWAKMAGIVLIESSCGEFFLVHQTLLCPMGEDGMEFRIFQVDTNRMECVELESIGKRTIFLSYSGSGFCCFSEGLRSNSIYYVVPNSRNLYIFDLNDRSTTLLLPCPAARRSQSICYWVEHTTFKKQ